MKKAVELYHSGYAEYILLKNAQEKGTTVEEAMSLWHTYYKILTENEAMSTYDNAYYSKEIILNHGFDSAIVVTSNYHMRRSQLAFERVFEKTDIKLTYVPYQHDFITRDNWSDNGQLFTREYIKLLGGISIYRVPGTQTIPKIYNLPVNI